MIEDHIADDKVKRLIYKTVNNVSLKMLMSFPNGNNHKRSIILFVHGGGWVRGKPEWFLEECKHFNDIGFITFSEEYRLVNVNSKSPADGISDVKDAIKWIRNNSVEFGTDPNQIVVVGASAGGHLAACSAMIINDEEKNEFVNSVPNALILWSSCVNPAVDNWFLSLLPNNSSPLSKEIKAKDYSPYHHIKSGLPPMILFHGTNDQIVPYNTAKDFTEEMQQMGNQCKLYTYEKRGHNFYSNPADYNDVLKKMDEFITNVFNKTNI